jgi:hypothetical protein
MAAAATGGGCRGRRTSRRNCGGGRPSRSLETRAMRSSTQARDCARSPSAALAALTVARPRIAATWSAFPDPSKVGSTGSGTSLAGPAAAGTTNLQRLSRLSLPSIDGPGLCDESITLGPPERSISCDCWPPARRAARRAWTVGRAASQERVGKLTRAVDDAHNARARLGNEGDSHVIGPDEIDKLRDRRTGVPLGAG